VTGLSLLPADEILAPGSTRPFHRPRSVHVSPEIDQNLAENASTVSSELASVDATDFTKKSG
jgi:hypothetical protein